MPNEPDTARTDQASRIEVAYDLIADKVPRRARPVFEQAWRELERGLISLERSEPSPAPTGTDPKDAEEGRGPEPARTEPIDLSWLEELGELEEPDLPARIRRIFPDIRAVALRAARDHWLSEDAVHEAVLGQAASRRFRTTPSSEAIRIERLVRGWALEERLVTTFETRYVRARREPYRSQTLSGDALEGLWERSPRDESTIWRRRGSEKIEICPTCRGRRRLDCDTCQGSGQVEGACTRCGGTGRFGPADDGDAPECPECEASGQASQPCVACDGDGSLECGGCRGSGSLLTFQEIESEVREISGRNRYAPDGVREDWLARAGGVRLPERSWERPMISLGLTPQGDEIATRQRLSSSVLPVTRARLRIEDAGAGSDPKRTDRNSMDDEAAAPTRTDIWFVGVGSPVYGSLALPVARRKIAIAAAAAVAGLGALVSALLIAF